MKILVLGGTLFIGLHTVKKLINMGHDVSVFHRGKHTQDLPKNLHRIIGDRKNLQDFKEEFKKLSPEVVLDMVPFSDLTAKKVVETFKGIVKRVVAISSCDVYKAYGIINESEPKNTSIQNEVITEHSPLRTVFYPYKGKIPQMEGYDKILAEKVYMNEPELSATILRLPMVYGNKDQQHRLFPYLKRMDDKRPKIIVDEITAKWRACRSYVGNVADAISLAIIDNRAEGKIYNVAEPYNFTEEEWIKQIAGITKWKGEIVIIPKEKMPSPGNLSQHLAIDSTKIRNELGYKETVPLTKAIKKTIEWERTNPPTQINPDIFDYEKEDKMLSEL